MIEKAIIITAMCVAIAVVGAVTKSANCLWALIIVGLAINDMYC